MVAGSNERGQLGMPHVETIDLFSMLHTCENYRVSEVFAGGDHSFVLLNGYVKEKDRWHHDTPSQPSEVASE